MEGFEETDRIQRSFFKKALRIPTRAAKGKQNWSWVEKIREERYYLWQLIICAWLGR